MLSNKNITELIDKGYEFILGGRIKNESDKKEAIILFAHQEEQVELLKLFNIPQNAN